MTQNNERVDITPLKQISAVQSIREAKTLEDAMRVMNGLGANGWLSLWDSATHPDGTSYRDKSPISQKEQQPKQIPDGWIEPQRVKVAIDEFRDLVLNQRGLLAENGMTNDMVNDVLSEFDYYFHDIKCAVPPAPTNTEVGE